MGDSVAWGQGLQPEHKFLSLVKDSLGVKECTVLAHSGAIIGVGATKKGQELDGEVPSSYPTILRQCDSFMGDPDEVDLILLNGGINDIGVRTILNPFTDATRLQDLITQHCHLGMKALLGKVLDIFTKPTLQIVVTSYFPILSKLSDPGLWKTFCLMHGLSLEALEDLPNLLGLGSFDVFAKIISNCDLFFQHSSHALKQAVLEANQSMNGNVRIFFAQPPFTEANAALAPNHWLWGVTLPTLAEDEVFDQRRLVCERDEKDLLRLPTCFLASVGHPNIEGAQQFTTAILQILQ